MGQKVVVIGLDGARLDLLYKWCRQGYLPNLSKMIFNGVNGNLKSVLPIHSFPAWTSLSTGVIPPKHGIYDALLRKNKDYHRIPPSSRFIKVKRFWEILDDMGYCCGVINVPVTYPPKPLKNGIIVSCVLTPSINHVFAHPKSVMKMLYNQKYKILPNAKPGTKKYIKEVHEILEKQYDLVKWFMKNYNWDCIFWVIMSTEMLHHHYASFIDKKHPLYNPTFENIVKELYIKIDAYVGNLISDISEDFILFLVSDHGFAPYYGTIYMNAFLKKWGFLKTKNKLYLIKYKVLNLLKSYGKVFYKYLPKDIQERAIKITGFGASEFTLDLIDWSKTKAYVATLDGHIFINLKGREKGGIVEKNEYESVVNEIINKIINEPKLKDIIEEVKRKNDIYGEGKYLDFVPDIFMIFKNANTKPFKIRTDPFAKNLIEYNLKQFNENIGYHTLYGTFVAYGKNIKSGYRINANILDITPTILATFGIKIPHYVDGIVLNNIFDNPNKILNGNMNISEKNMIRRIIRKKFKFK